MLARDRLKLRRTAHQLRFGQEGLVAFGQLARFEQDFFPPGAVPAQMIDRKVGGDTKEPRTHALGVGRNRGLTALRLEQLERGLLHQFFGHIGPQHHAGQVRTQLASRLLICLSEEVARGPIHWLPPV